MSINKKQLDILNYIENVLATVENEKFTTKNVRLYKSFSDDYDKNLVIVANEKYYERLYKDLRRDGLAFDTVPAYLDEDGTINCYRIESEFDYFDDYSKGIIFKYGINEDRTKMEFLGVINEKYAIMCLPYLDKAMTLLDYYNEKDALNFIKNNDRFLDNTNTNIFSKKMIKTLNRI